MVRRTLLGCDDAVILVDQLRFARSEWQRGLARVSEDDARGGSRR